MNIIIRGFCALIISIIIIPFTASAQQGGQGLEISPPVIDNLRGDPGQTLTAKIRLRNVSKGPLVVKGKADDFGAKGEDGEPQIMLDETEATRYSLKFWVEPLSSFQLAPGEARVLPIKIILPLNAEPGGHYGVIRFTASPPELEDTGVSLSASLGALVLLTVSGDVSEKLELVEFKSGQDGKFGWLFENGPITLTERIRNSGSVHVKPVGHVEIYNIFGKRIAQLAISDPARNVLPESVRKFEQTLTTRSLFGRYTAKLSATYGDKKSLSAEKVFWVIPFKLILVILIIVLVLIYALRLGIKKYNRWIIQQAKK